MVSQETKRPVVPTTHYNEVEHRRLLANRVNASLPADGTAPMTAPLALSSYTIAELPDPTLWPGSLIYNSDNGAHELYDVQADPGELYNLWDDGRCFKQRGDLIERLMVFTMGYSPESSYATDAVAGQELMKSQSWRLHGGEQRWSDFARCG